MKNMKGRILRKLKSISTPTWGPGLVMSLNVDKWSQRDLAGEGSSRMNQQLSEANTPIQAFQTSNLGKEKNHCLPPLTCENLNISEIAVDVEEEKLASSSNAGSKEKCVLSIEPKEERVLASESKPDEIAPYWEAGTSACSSSIVEMESPSDSMEDHMNCEPIEYKDKHPPGGRDSLVLYTTSLRGIRKTFEDCNTIRFLLQSFRVLFSERDVSMHLEYRDELWRILGGRVVPPRLFIRGRYIGGADEVVGLHEKGMLGNLLQGIPLSPSNCPCRGCAGMGFVLCCSCNGSRKVVPEGQNNGSSIKCPDCNENGLIKCSVCS